MRLTEYEQTQLATAKKVYGFFKNIKPRDQTIEQLNNSTDESSMIILIELREKLSKVDGKFTIDCWFVITHLLARGYFYDRAFEKFMVYSRDHSTDKFSADRLEELEVLDKNPTTDKSDLQRVAKAYGKARFAAHYFRMQLEQHENRRPQSYYDYFESEILKSLNKSYLEEELEDEKIMKKIKENDILTLAETKRDIKEWFARASDENYDDKSVQDVTTPMPLSNIVGDGW